MKPTQKIQQWTIKKLLAHWERLNLTPKYQRGKVWDDRRNILLISSILKGLDIPKVYLHPVNNNVLFDFEVIDGQQRLRAIHGFANKSFALAETDGVVVTGGSAKFFDELTTKQRKRFESYKLTISIAAVSPNDARVLFSRLQLGATLNQAELRNALASNACHEIDSIVLNHAFFKDSKIAEARFKRHDYLTHALAYVCLNADSVAFKDIKASTLRHFILAKQSGLGTAQLQHCTQVLDVMNAINQTSPGLFRNKWTFVDTYLYLAIDKSRLTIPPASAAVTLKQIESERRQYNSNPELLLGAQGQSPSDSKALYHYINAYKVGGSLCASIATRLRLLEKRLTT